jgi:hypothetical protein
MTKTPLDEPAEGYGPWDRDEGVAYLEMVLDRLHDDIVECIAEGDEGGAFASIDHIVALCERSGYSVELDAEEVEGWFNWLLERAQEWDKPEEREAMVLLTQGELGAYLGEDEEEGGQAVLSA